MKPRIRFSRGLWHCGKLGDHSMWWTCARTPKLAYELWARFN